MLSKLSMVYLASRGVIIGLNCWPQFTLERINSTFLRFISTQGIAFELS